MKNTLMCAMVVMLTFVLNVGQAVAAGNANPGHPDSILVAREIARNPVVYYVFDVYYYVAADGSHEPGHMSGLYKPDVGITQLTVDGVQIVGVGDEPLLSLPRPQNGKMKWLNAYADGINQYRERVVYGSAYDDLLNPGEAIQFSVKTAPRQMLISYANPGGYQNPLIRLYFGDGGYTEAYYSGADGGFRIWLDPSVPEYEYEIISGGQIVDRGIVTIDGGNNDTVSSGNAMTFNLAGGVVSTDITTGYHSYENLVMDGATSISGSHEPAKVFLVRKWGSDMIGGGMNNTSLAIIDAYGVEADGSLTPLDVWVDYYEYGNRSFLIDGDGFENTIVVFRGVVPLDETFGVSFYPESRR